MVKSVDEVEEMLRSKLYRRFGNLQQAFRGLDRSNNGMITLRDLKESLLTLLPGLELSDNDLEMLAARFDATGNGVITWAEFLDRLREAETAARIQIARGWEAHALEPVTPADEVLMRVKAKVDEHFSSLREAFLAIDLDRSGFISKDEFEKVVFEEWLVETEEGGEVSPVIAKNPAIRDLLFKKYDLTGDGRIHYSEFMKVMATSSEFGLHMHRAYEKGRQV